MSPDMGVAYERVCVRRYREICNDEDYRIARAAIALANGEAVGYRDRSRVMEFLHVNGFGLDFPVKVGEYAFAELYARYRIAYPTLMKIAGGRPGFGGFVDDCREKWEMLKWLFKMSIYLPAIAFVLCIVISPYFVFSYLYRYHWYEVESPVFWSISMTVLFWLAVFSCMFYRRFTIPFLVGTIRRVRAGFRRIEEISRP